MLNKIIFSLYIAVFAIGLSFTSGCSSSPKVVEVTEVDTVVVVEKEPTIKFGFVIDTFDVYYDTIQPNWTMSHMLLPYGLSQAEVNEAAILATDSIVGLNYVRPDQAFMVLAAQNDTSKRAQYIVYESSIFDYVVFDFTDGIKIKKVDRDITVERKTLSGEIVQNSNLTIAINDQVESYRITAALAEGIEDIYAWSIDFFKLQAGDQFKIIYNEKSIEGEPIGIGDIEAMWFNHESTPYYAFLYETDTVAHTRGYYDEKAKEMKRPFLMSPVKFSRISSGYNLKRYHPVQKRVKPHLGTDYAAPTGTPIMATADGRIIAAQYSRYNGNYVKIYHNDTYTTQYLHMSKIGEGIKKGKRVKQGAIIGYVGSTGLATGPHVCYRFWKNGKQVNHRAMKFPSSLPMKKELIPEYMKFIEPFHSELDSISITPYKIIESDSLLFEE